jgi:hypothetical protein
VNPRWKVKDPKISFSAVVLSIFIIVASLVATTGCCTDRVMAQRTPFGNVTDNQIKENKAPSTSNLTRQEINPILGNLFTARNELLRGNSPSALDALNAATSQLFNLTIRMGGNDNKDALSQLLDPLRMPIERARNHLLSNNNITATILNLNIADSEFIKLTLKIPG